MTVGGVLREAWRRYRGDLRRYVAIAAVGAVVVQVLDVLATEAGTAVAVLAGLGVLLGSFVPYAALVHGGRAGAGAGEAIVEAYGATFSRLGTVLAAGVVTGLGILVGLLLLVVPGLLLATRWSLVPQAIMLEGAGWREAMRRSAELVRPRFRPMLGVVLVTFAASAVIVLVPMAVEVGVGGRLSGWIIGVVAGTLFFPYFALVFNAAYARLADRPAEPDVPSMP